jgi:GGDEF domain-containing protein
MRDGVLLARWFILYELEREIARARRHRRPLSIVILHPAPAISGRTPVDVMIDIAAETASSVARTTDLVGWLPGGRILVIMPETDQDQARSAAFRWRNEMYSRTSHLGGLRWNPTIVDAFAYSSGESLIEAMSRTSPEAEAA